MELERLKAQYGELYEIACGEVVVVCRRPSRGEFYRCQELLMTPGRPRATAFEQLVRDCTVSPPPDALDALLDRYPGAAVAIGARLLELAGLSEEARVKAL